ncbi:hypothetical protein AX016_1050 [Cellulophaga sp. RHA19]|uniref:hypothetical protein n=1 Tax=Cellulophaga sp. RHA19 TaxID=1798237 RepID=UPI000C2C9143|nr:hypothetical protein [Cellulophaga sp. RHA19]PKB42875.1 hypothetical protein AX016_1050 [Cellulophaga sp. RHA19]
MNFFKTLLIILSIILLESCASGYKTLELNSMRYLGTNVTDSIKFDYRYNLLSKKYAKKEIKKGIKVIAVKITNNSSKDLVFGEDVKLTQANGNEIYVMDNEYVYKSLKQSPASYLWYLFLTPLNLYTTSTETTSNGYTRENTNSIPIGLAIGPGLTGGNMIAASSANKKFKQDLLTYSINGTVLKKGETTYGLVGIESKYKNALKLILNSSKPQEVNN